MARSITHGTCARLAATIGIAAALGWAFDARAGNFVIGDVYLYTQDLPDVGSAVVRIDPVSGVASVLYEPNSYVGTSELTYDPCRDRLIIRETGANDAFTLIAADGSTSQMIHGWPRTQVNAWCPTHDGRIYMVTNGIGYFGYVDACGVAHDLMDTDGVTPFNYLYGASSNQGMVYDQATNALFLINDGAATEVIKFPLSVDGSQLSSAPVSASFDALAEWDAPAGFGAGPDGTIFIKLDPNGSNSGPLMLMVDPVLLAFSTYAIINHAFLGGDTTGTYNSTYDYALSLDTFDDIIRKFVESAVPQEGVEFTPDISGNGGSGEAARLITIGDTVITTGNPDDCTFCAADVTADGQVGVGDLLQLLSDWGPCALCPSDVNGDGVVNVTDLLELLAGWGPCCPE